MVDPLWEIATPIKTLEVARRNRYIRSAFVVMGDIYPYVRTTQRQKWVDQRYRRYANSQANIRQMVGLQMAAGGWEKSEQEPLGLGIYIWTTAHLHRRDMSNIFKAAEDALQGIAYGNDCWVDAIFGARWKADYDVAIIMLTPPTPLVQIMELANKAALALGQYYLLRMKGGDLGD